MFVLRSEFVYIRWHLFWFECWSDVADLTSARDVALQLSSSRSLLKHRVPPDPKRPAKFENDVTRSIEHLIPDASNRRSVNADVMTSRTARMEGTCDVSLRSCDVAFLQSCFIH